MFQKQISNHEIICCSLTDISIYDFLFVFSGEDGSFDYISVTPPYAAVDYGILMNQISKSSIVGENTFVVSVSVIVLYKSIVFLSATNFFCGNCRQICLFSWWSTP